MCVCLGVDSVWCRFISQGDHVFHLRCSFRPVSVNLVVRVCRRCAGPCLTGRGSRRPGGDGDGWARRAHRRDWSHTPGTCCRDFRLCHVLRGTVRAPVDALRMRTRGKKTAEDIGCCRRLWLPCSARDIYTKTLQQLTQ